MFLSHVWYYLFFVASFKVIGFLMGVMTKSFALPIDLYKPLRNSKNVYFTKILFEKILSY